MLSYKLDKLIEETRIANAERKSSNEKLFNLVNGMDTTLNNMAPALYTG